MNHQVKKNIRIVAEKFCHTIEYFPDCMLISNSCNTVKLSQKNKYKFDLTYNSEKSEIAIKVAIEDIYDVLIDLLRRTHLYIPPRKPGHLLALKDWHNEESHCQRYFDALISNLKIGPVDYRDLGGNRIEAEYYKGLILLTDDLNWSKSNVIELKTIVFRNPENESKG